MKCPKCGLFNPKSAMWCDCGYEFVKTEGSASFQKFGKKEIDKRPELSNEIKSRIRDTGIEPDALSNEQLSALESLDKPEKSHWLAKMFSRVGFFFFGIAFILLFAPWDGGFYLIRLVFFIGLGIFFYYISYRIQVKISSKNFFTSMSMDERLKFFESAEVNSQRKMGLFDLFRGYTEIEKVLIKLHGKELVDQAIENSKNRGTYNLPNNFGEIILGKAESTSTFVKKLGEMHRQELPKKRAEGVRDEDILWWWNINEVEREAMDLFDNTSRMATFIHVIRTESFESKEELYKEASKRVRKTFPMFGDPADTEHTEGDDRPLPYELKDRVNIYTGKRMMSDPESYKKEIESSTTINAHIRKAIQEGNC